MFDIKRQRRIDPLLPATMAASGAKNRAPPTRSRTSRSAHWTLVGVNVSRGRSSRAWRHKWTPRTSGEDTGSRFCEHSRSRLARGAGLGEVRKKRLKTSCSTGRPKVILVDCGVDVSFVAEKVQGFSETEVRWFSRNWTTQRIWWRQRRLTSTNVMSRLAARNRRAYEWELIFRDHGDTTMITVTQQCR